MRASADDATREHVDDERDVHAAAPRRAVREVCHPQLIGPLGVELPLHQILRVLRCGVGVRRAMALAAHDATRAPAAMSRATVHRATDCPSRNNCCHTLRTPYTPRWCSHKHWIQSRRTASRCARAGRCVARARLAGPHHRALDRTAHRRPARPSAASVAASLSCSLSSGQSPK